MVRLIRESIAGVYGEEKLARWIEELGGIKGPDQAACGEEHARDDHVRMIMLTLLVGRKHRSNGSLNTEHGDDILSRYANELLSGGDAEVSIAPARIIAEDIMPRLFGPSYLGVFEHVPSAEEVHELLERWSLAHNLTVEYIVKILEIFCADDYAGICGSEPRCDRCMVRPHCSYGKNRHSPYGEFSCSLMNDNEGAVHGFLK